MADPRKPSSSPASSGTTGQRPAARTGAQRPAGNRPGGGNPGNAAPRRPSNPPPAGKPAAAALDPQQAIKRQLARRMAFAAGLIALLLGALALFDHLGTNKPPKDPATPPAVTAPADKVADATDAPAKAEKPADNVASGKLETEPRPAPAPSDKPAEGADKVTDSKPATDSQGKPVILPPPPAPAAVPSAPTAPAGPSSPTAPHAPSRTASAAPAAPVRGADAAAVNKPAAPVLPRPSPGDARSEGVTRPLRHSAGGDVTAPTAPAKPSVTAPAAPSAPRVVAAEPEFTADPSVPVPRAEPARPASSIGTVPPRPVANGYVLQAGVFASHQRAEELLAKLQLSGIPATIESRVQVGPFKTREEADAVRAKLRELGISEAILVPPRAASKR